MPHSAKAVPRRPRWLRGRGRAPRHGTRPAWLPVWSPSAALRAARATIVMPGLFALTAKVIGDPQMTLFAVFGSFATLVMASFGGTRRDKAMAHLMLAVAGSAALIIGTLVSGNAWLAALVTIPVTFAIFFAGAAGRTAGGGVTAALLGYILPVASPAAAGTIGSRLAGWWLASAVGTAAVLLTSPRSPGDRLRAAAAATATALAEQLAAAVAGMATSDHAEAAKAAWHRLKEEFAAGPYRPTGLATTDQGLANVVELLEWSASLIRDALDGHLDTDRAPAEDRDLLGSAAGLLSGVAALLTGGETSLDSGRLDAMQAASAARQRALSAATGDVREGAAIAAHAQAIALAARAAAADALIVAGKADPGLIAAERRRWYGQRDGGPPGHAAGLAAAAGLLGRHASLRSVWFRNSARGAIALAVAVAVAYVSGVQHGFWVALGALSVLRTTAAATGSTAVRALAGTVAGFAVGAALLLGIGTAPAALWAVLPIAVFVAAYAPGTLPFTAGQAAFTVTVVVIFNLLAPAGWRVGLLRIEDVAIGCAVSLVAGILFWPRGTASVVGDDLADAFRNGAKYLIQSVDWALGLRRRPAENAVPTVTASIRLSEALRAYLAEQGSKRLRHEELWSLVMGATRLRLTAFAVASLPRDGQPPATPGDGAGPGTDPLLDAFRKRAADLAGFYEQVATEVGPPGRQPRPPVVSPGLDGIAYPEGVACAGTAPAHYRADMLWVGEHLYHLAVHGRAITAPAAKVAELRQLPWWR